MNLGNIEIADIWLGATQVKSVYFGGKEVWSGEEPGQVGDWLCFTAEQANSTVGLDTVGSPDAISLQYSTDDGDTWTSYSWSGSTGDTITLVDVGNKVMFRASSENSTISKTTNDYYLFVITGQVAASGNIQTLLKADGSRTDAPAYCYNQMFLGCSSLTTAPALPATTLADYCYSSMFNGCSSLTTAPALPATTLANNCYGAMFLNCTSLTTAPALPATTLAQSCYNQMFYGCSSLTTAPALPATTLAVFCYFSMFVGCTSLTTAPATLPATSLVAFCYQNMFYNCSSLTTAPELPATTLDFGCYSSMFDSCSALTTAPALPATTLASNCYSSMFVGCTSLSSVEVAFTEWPSNGATTNWLNNVAASGTFTCPATLPDTRGASNIPTGWTKKEPADTPLTFTATQTNSAVRLNKDGSPNAISLETSTDGNTWTNYSWTGNTGDTLTLANVGDKVMFRASSENSTISKTTNDYYLFVITGQVAASGNIQTLLKADGTRTDAPAYCYYNMFSSTSLTTAPVLPATTLGSYCYSSMFADCTSLTSAPALPATTLADYCYSDMFNGCTSLTSAPALPATSTTPNCYQSMFNGCTSLTSAPALPAKAIADYCYSDMFNGCTSLTSAPALPATSNALAWAYYCYNNMFRNCTSLSSVEVAFTAWPGNGSTTNWLNNVAASGTFICPSTLPDTRGSNKIPTGWTKTDLT